MAPKRKVEDKAPPRSSPSVKASLSPRRTRSSSAAAGAPAVPPEVPPPAKKPKKATRGKLKDEVKESGEPALAVETVVADKDSSKTIIVEACKQCHQFKKRASMVKDGLENGVPGINVVVNPEKPRRGCFEIRDANGQTFVSLLNMPRPFTRMRELDMDALISDIIEKVK
ncbi:unnamed protein product [Spirodela intermedia]|uniref:Uncharacterized protein n=1 Tax=Spirodela intermedia TaxID=51605 RepID=A0A7I8LDU0_SPIIN|nr:unnamed protein product [Spirodela intermedia]